MELQSAAVEAAALSEFSPSESAHVDRAAVARAGPPPTTADHFNAAQVSHTLLQAVLLTVIENPKPMHMSPSCQAIKTGQQLKSMPRCCVSSVHVSAYQDVLLPKSMWLCVKP